MRVRWIRLSVLALLAGFLHAGCESVQPVPQAALDASDGIRAEAIAEHMRFLAGDDLEGRGTGTRGYLLAAEYVASRFGDLGLEPAGEDGGFFQDVSLLRTDLLEEHTSLVLLKDDGKTPLELDRHYVMDGDPLRERAELTASLVYAGFGVTAAELNHDDYAGIDVNEKIVVLFRGAPSTFPHDQRAYYSSSRVKRENAVARGAVGLVSMMLPEEQRRRPWDRTVRQSKMGAMRWLDGSGRPAETPPELFVNAQLGGEGMEVLFAHAPRPLAEVVREAEAGRPRPFDLALKMAVKSASIHGLLSSPNVIGLLRGSDPAREHVVLTAHLDHLGLGEPVDGDTIYNGAYDNASGVAILLEVAAALAGMPDPPPRSVLFLVVTGEEKGLLGSKYFVEHPTVPLASIVAEVNLDMVLMPGPLHDVVAFGAEHSTLAGIIERAAEQMGLRLAADPIPEEVIFVRSDQFPFVRKGIPSAFMVSWFDCGDPGSLERFRKWMREVYHSPADDMEQAMNLEAGADFARVNLLTTYLIADAPERPVWNAGDFFGDRFGGAAAPPE